MIKQRRIFSPVHFFVMLLCLLMLTGCGVGEQIYEESNYESLTNESGDIQCYSGGVLIETFENAKILYSSANTEAAFIIAEDGSRHYWQGHMMMKIK